MQLHGVYQENFDFLALVIRKSLAAVKITERNNQPSTFYTFSSACNLCNRPFSAFAGSVCFTFIRRSALPSSNLISANIIMFDEQATTKDAIQVIKTVIKLAQKADRDYDLQSKGKVLDIIVEILDDISDEDAARPEVRSEDRCKGEIRPPTPEEQPLSVLKAAKYLFHRGLSVFCPQKAVRCSSACSRKVPHSQMNKTTLERILDEVTNKGSIHKSRAYNATNFQGLATSGPNCLTSNDAPIACPTIQRRTATKEITESKFIVEGNRKILVGPPQITRTVIVEESGPLEEVQPKSSQPNGQEQNGIETEPAPNGTNYPAEP